MVANRVAVRGETADRIEALLSARLFVEPQLADDRLYFISNLGGALSLYAMDADGGVPEPLLPPKIALQNPELLAAYSFYVFTELGQILVMLDHDGDEKYKPYVIPLEGGFPEPIGGDSFDGFRSRPLQIDHDGATAYFLSESLTEPMIHALRLDLQSGRVDEVAKSQYGAFAVAWNSDHSRVVLGDQYSSATPSLWEPDGSDGRKLIYGTAIEEREEGRDYPRTASSRRTCDRAAWACSWSRRCTTTRARPAISRSTVRATSSRSTSMVSSTAAKASSSACSTSTTIGMRRSTTSTAAPGRTTPGSTKPPGA